MYSNTQKVWRLILLALVGFGFIHLMINRTSTALIMLAMIGIIFYLYKRPPQWLIRLSYPQKGGAGMRSRHPSPRDRKNKKTSKKKKHPFRVIDGNKKDTLRIKKSQ
ncbi:hypothetical protein [Desmospora profundinema]|uniref:Uncharacterized protein n=1 Tax=Desmospora profundinema TaxID=1571184 RepID=A0ABU1IJW7_9BACL|nr:hypothetical protein [Desmospora profundinema]MDR6224673.1 hypothetical protein [Desmospora profundinema]